MISKIDIDDMGPPQIEVEEVCEQEDGTMLCTISLNAAGSSLLMEMGFNSLLVNYINKMKKDADF
jgi:hypothetical protein